MKCVVGRGADSSPEGRGTVNRPKIRVLTELEKQSKMAGAVLSGRHFTDVDLSVTIFERATCDRARFVGVDLSGANFSAASLVGTVFLQCDIADASFRGADVHAARFIECRGWAPETMRELRARGAIVWERALSAT
jgi:uncharacterized protein YjbI with pentapeptide repeats